ncbi:MAG: helix-turn-helix transcriptional regulator [Paludibacteraceae bacterium]|nr:helix-turn-helix transcriptional regulator [Paludibacteraceae bacterium]
MSIKRTLYIALILLPVILFAVLYSLIRKPTINVLSDEAFQLEMWDEPMAKGFATTEFRWHDGKASFKFNLSDSLPNAYAGLSVANKIEPLFSLTNYELRIKLRSEENVPLIFRINEYIEDYTDKNRWDTYLLCSKTESITKGENEIRLKVKDINETPNWWYAINQAWATKDIHTEKSEISELTLVFENGVPLGKDILIDIQEFKMVYDSSAFSPYLIALLLYYIIFATFYFIKRAKAKSEVKYVVVPIKEIETKGEKAKGKDVDIVSFIGENYPNPDFKVSDVANHFKLTENEVSDILKEYCDKTFRQYLNQIRMEEAKRLLKESKQQISSIAFSVGYNNVQHFNRVFKEYTGVSPTVFKSGKEGESEE